MALHPLAAAPTRADPTRLQVVRGPADAALRRALLRGRAAIDFHGRLRLAGRSVRSRLRAPKILTRRCLVLIDAATSEQRDGGTTARHAGGGGHRTSLARATFPAGRRRFALVAALAPRCRQNLSAMTNLPGTVIVLAAASLLAASAAAPADRQPRPARRRAETAMAALRRRRGRDELWIGSGAPPPRRAARTAWPAGPPGRQLARLIKARRHLRRAAESSMPAGASALVRQQPPPRRRMSIERQHPTTPARQSIKDHGHLPAGRLRAALGQRRDAVVHGRRFALTTSRARRRCDQPLPCGTPIAEPSAAGDHAPRAASR